METAVLATEQPPKISIPFWRRFRFNLILFFVALAVLPLTIISFINISQQIQQAEAQVTEQLQSITELKVNQLSLWLDQGQLALNIILSNNAFRQSVIQAITEPETFTDEQREQLIDDLRAFAQTNAYFESFIIYTSEGRVIFASMPADVGKVVTLQPYFNDSLLQREHLQAPFYDISNTQLTMYATHHIVGDNRERVAILAGKINLTVLGDIMTERTGLSQSGETYLVSRQNSYLLTPSRFEGYERQRAYRSEGIDNALDNQDGSGVYLNYQDPPQPVIGVYRWVSILEAALLAEVNQDEVLAGARQAQLNNAVIAFVVAGVAAITGLIYANRLSRPIAQLTTSANQFSSGDLKHRTAVAANNEIGVLAESFNSMAEQIEQRILETQAALERAERADYADKVKSAFLASMSHELRTPLNAVINFTRFVVDGDTGPVNEEQSELLNEVVKSATHLLALINDVLDMSKIEAGALVLFVEDNVDLSALLKNVMNTARGLIGEKPVVLETDIAPNLPLIRADRQRVLQVLMNIISNACKFTTQGSIILTGKVMGDEVVISISDTGTGIDPDDQAMVFQPFRQTKSGLRQGGGTGLGMPIAKSLVEAHYGRLWLESTPGEGTTFHLALPLKDRRLEPAIF